MKLVLTSAGISNKSIENFIHRFEWADVFYFEGGNTQWLRKSIKK